MVTQLLWKVREPLRWRVKGPVKHIDSSQYIAPSWSWASVTSSAVEMYRFFRPDIYTDTALIDILDARVELVADDPFGKVSGGFLSV